MGTVEEDTMQYYKKNAQQEKLLENIQKEVSKMTLKDVIWDITSLRSNEKLYGKVFALIEETYRSHHFNATIDSLLENLLSMKVEDDKNICVFIEDLYLEDTIRQMLIEQMYDYAVDELEQD